MAAVNAFGTIFGIGDGEISESFTPVAEVTNISGPSLSRDSIEVTSHGSTDGYREYIPGLTDGGEVTIDLNWNHTSHDDVWDLIDSEENNVNFEVLFPDATSFIFSGHATGFEVTAPIDDKLTASVTFKVSGQPTLETEEDE